MQKLSISGYVLKWNANIVRKGLSFQLSRSWMVKTFVVYTVALNSVRTGVKCFLKRLTRVYLTGYTKRKKSCQNLMSHVRINGLCDSPIESFRGWSLFGLIASIKESLMNTELRVYRRGVSYYS